MAAVLLAVPLIQFVGATTAGATPTVTAQRTATLHALITSAQKHRSPSAFFTRSATLKVDKQSIHGIRAITAWWRGQFRAGLKISLMSPVTVRQDTGQALLHLATRSGTCASGCLEGASWRFSGTHVRTMTLTRLKGPPLPSPPSNVPKPPSSSPKITPTIPT